MAGSGSLLLFSSVPFYAHLSFFSCVRLAPSSSVHLRSSLRILSLGTFFALLESVHPLYPTSPSFTL